MNSTKTAVREESEGAEKSSRYSSTIAYFYAFIALGLTAAVLGPTLPTLALQTHTDLSQISLLFSARSFGYLLGSLLLGSLYDRVSGHLLMAGMLAVMAITLALVPVTAVLWLMIAIFLLLGVGEGAVDVGGNLLLVWTHRRQVGPFMNGMHFFFGLGAFLSPMIIAWVVLVTGNFHWAFWILALFVIPLALWLPRLASPLSPSDGEEGQPVHVQPFIILLIALFFFLYVGSEASYGGWIFSYSLEKGLANDTTAAYLTSFFWGALTVGRLASIPLAVKFKPGMLLLADLIGCLIALILILAFPGSQAAIWAGTAGVGLAMASIFPTMLSSLDNYSKKVRD
jgi:FHS family Na+ dependent glucose MFS transporter 1